MLVIFPILFCFSFFIWSFSVLMMMQIVRCESAVAQGLRSDTLQATKRRKAQACNPHPLTPFGLLVVDLSPLTTSLAPERYQISDIIGILKSKKNT